MGLVDYHTHTALCGHATGSVDDYVRAAVERGLSEIGFSDHAPLPGHLREGITMKPDEMEFYLGLVADARDRHDGTIIIKTGMEVDYPFHDSLDPRYFNDARIDYLIGSCHFIDEWPFDHPGFMDEFERRDIDEVYRRYYEILGGLIRTGMFNIIGHLDLVKKFGHRPRADFASILRELARLCAASGTAVEINTAGLRKPVGELYPSRMIIDILFDENVPVTLGSDAHAPGEVAHEFHLAVGELHDAGYRSIAGFAGKKRYAIPL
jgi:histidinol-phosphatase (PHP family)